MAARRDYSITPYAVPKFMGRALSEPKYLPLLFAIPAIILFLLLGWLGHLTSLPVGQIVYSKFFPIIYIEAIFVAATTLSGIGAVVAVSAPSSLAVDLATELGITTCSKTTNTHPS